MNILNNKVAVITGASSGIGAAIACTFAREGARVIMNCNKSFEKAGKIAAQLNAEGNDVSVLQGDMSQPEQIDRIIDTVLHEAGKIDIWVNNAGADILTGEGVRLTDQQKLQALIDVDLMGTINSCWKLLPFLKKQGQGVIINMSWDLALHGFAGRNPEVFAAIKSGVSGFSRAIAKSSGPEVRVNVLAPGWIRTGFAEEVMSEEYYQARITEIPLGRFGIPEEVAETALFLASSDASYITGEIIKVNGGLV